MHFKICGSLHKIIDHIDKIIDVGLHALLTRTHSLSDCAYSVFDDRGQYPPSRLDWAIRFCHVNLS